jgi:N-acetylmuramoyl-L-alanine amidase
MTSIYFITSLLQTRKDIATNQEGINMLQGKKFIKVLSAVTVCTMFTAGFTTQAASSMPEAFTIDTVDKGENTEAIGRIPALEMKDTKKAATDAKTAYDAEQRRIKEEQERIAAEAQRAAEEAQRAAEEEAALSAAAEASAMPVAAGELLASIIFCEAGNQPYDGQVAVGAVIMNRVRSGVYPNSVAEVIYQSGQFGPAMTGWLDSVLASGGYTDTAMQAAADAIAGANPIGDCLYFGNGDWGIQIGDHFFH